MVVLAQALVSQPKYVIIDELSLGLAPVVVQRLIPTHPEVAESGIGVLLIEQFATVALGLANRAHVMEAGQIRYSGLATELREQPELLAFGVPAARGTGTKPRRPRASRAGEAAGERHRAASTMLVLSDDIEATRDFYAKVSG